jgi:CRISPR/Cas system-associated protein Csm6
MQTTPTHLASGAIVISVDELTAEDLQHLLDLKRSEPERIRAREEEELRHMLWRLLHRMPAETAAEIAELLSDTSPAVVLADYFDGFLLAHLGRRSVEVVTIGHCLNTSASVAA